MKATDLFIRALENEGVEFIFGVPGEENLDFIESLYRSKIKLIITRHEQGAGFMAATYGRLTGHPGVCLSTLGPGATNLVTPAAYAQLGGMPMLLITGQKPIKKSKQGQFQIIDVVELMQPITKRTKQIVYGSNIPSQVRESFRLAMEERPGAVHLELPEDVAIEDTEDELHVVNIDLRPEAHDESIIRSVKMLEAARSPLILIAAGANRKRTRHAIKLLVDKTGIPFVTTQMGKGVIDERHPLYMGTAALSDHDFIHYAINRSDLILNVGHDIIEKPPFIMKQGGTKVIHVNFTSAQIDRVYFPQLNVVGDIAHSIERITQLIEHQSHWDFKEYVRVMNEIDNHIQEKANDNSFPVKPQRLVQIVRNVMPSDGTLALDNGIYKIWFARNYEAHQPNTVLLDNALASMGAGLPSAIAAKLIDPTRKVLAICGDGGFMMNSQELETAVRLNLNLVILILNDGAYGMIKWKQEGMGFHDYGLEFNNPDFVAYANSYGAVGHRISNTEEFENVLKECIFGTGVHLIDVPVDYSENHSVLTKELKDRVRGMYQ